MPRGNIKERPISYVGGYTTEEVIEIQRKVERAVRKELAEKGYRLCPACGNRVKANNSGILQRCGCGRRPLLLDLRCCGGCNRRFLSYYMLDSCIECSCKPGGKVPKASRRTKSKIQQPCRCNRCRE